MAEGHVVIDYQNIHLTAHGLWCAPGDAPHLCLIHPLQFANQIIAQRNLIQRLVAEAQGATYVDLTLAGVHVFRGQPSNKNDPRNYARTQAQRAEWTKDRRVSVTYRPLKYYDDGSVKEKGIDVHVALSLVTQAAQADAKGSVVILAAHDTDQEPALALARQLAGKRVETAGWHGARVLRVTGEQIWHTKLDDQAFQRSIDRKQYA